ncbi:MULTISPECIES: hypothetical protein [unclassified Mesorhizobium]|uniref:alpha-glutamyl/putrescinyl thymine pyrophosphorylase clade 3 protein n=1 Tax=unclassified Mesorhizobium TaxID=325217 RepID=UPI000FCBB8B5|nr:MULTISPECIES: hypothetical protein [unclassified Mesorhizobium]RUW71125.1 hypothetical protein EOA31_18665 [Mesorhizobium sp. M4B.F.Ca.ET.049.02.1.2]TGV23184.1 hypothetical protein EN786_25140 [Mesorhizobium sp. M4B.F.Ca.ET.143.01.1.1]
MRGNEVARAAELDAGLVDFAANTPLPGIANAEARSVLVEQLVESCRRIDFVTRVAERGISPERENPHSPIFDPIRAAILKMLNGEMDEAYWLIFLAIHFGKHSDDGWELVRNVYGRLGALPIWTWASVVANPAAFRQWMGANGNQLAQWRFGNHRKYESLSAVSESGTPSVVESYIAWVGPPRTHAAVVQNAQQQVGHDPGAIFDFLYKSMAGVARFGRLATFDYLTMIAKVGLATIRPPTAYLAAATGPKKGARLLFGGARNAKISPRELEGRLVELDKLLNVGQQVLEDALCNWQKSPTSFVPFR